MGICGQNLGFSIVFCRRVTLAIAAMAAYVIRTQESPEERPWPA